MSTAWERVAGPLALFRNHLRLRDPTHRAFGGGEFSAVACVDYEKDIGRLLAALGGEMAAGYIDVLPTFNEEMRTCPVPYYRFALDFDVTVTELDGDTVPEFLDSVRKIARYCLDWFAVRLDIPESDLVALVNGKPFARDKGDGLWKLSAHVRFPGVILPHTWHYRWGKWLERAIPKVMRFETIRVADRSEPLIDLGPLRDAKLRMILTYYLGREPNVLDVHMPLMELWHDGTEFAALTRHYISRLGAPSLRTVEHACSRWRAQTRLAGDERQVWFNWSLFPRKDQLKPTYPTRMRLWLEDRPKLHFDWPARRLAQAVEDTRLYRVKFAYDRGFWTHCRRRLHLLERDDGLVAFMVYGRDGTKDHSMENPLVLRDYYGDALVRARDAPEDDLLPCRPTVAPMPREFTSLQEIPSPFLVSEGGGLWQFAGDGIRLAHPDGVPLARRELVGEAFGMIGVRYTYEDMDTWDANDVGQYRMPSVDEFLAGLGEQSPFELPDNERLLISLCGIVYGAGKTHLSLRLMVDAASRGWRVLYINPRARLSGQVVTRLIAAGAAPDQVGHYSMVSKLRKAARTRRRGGEVIELDGADEELRKSIMVTTVHSLDNVTGDQYPFDMVVIDEVRTVERDFVADYTRDKSASMMQATKRVVRAAKCTIVLDADEDPFTALFGVPTLYEQVYDDDAAVTVHYKRVTNSRREQVLNARPRRPCTRVTTSDFQDKIIEYAREKRKIAVFFASKARMEEVRLLLLEEFEGDLRVMSISAHNAADYEGKDLAELCIDIDVLMYTTCWAVGMDIDMEAMGMRLRRGFRILFEQRVGFALMEEDWDEYVRAARPFCEAIDSDLTPKLDRLQAAGYRFEVMMAEFSVNFDAPQQMQAINRVRQYDRFVFSLMDARDDDRRMWLEQFAPPCISEYDTIDSLLKYHLSNRTAGIFTQSEWTAWEANRYMPRLRPEVVRAVAAQLTQFHHNTNCAGHLLEGLHRMRFDVSTCFKPEGSWAVVGVNPLRFYHIGAMFAEEKQYRQRLATFMDIRGMAEHEDGGRLRLDAFMVAYGFQRLEYTFRVLHNLRALHAPHATRLLSHTDADGVVTVSRGDDICARRCELLYQTLEAYFPDAVEFLFDPDDPAHLGYEPKPARLPTAQELAVIRDETRKCALTLRWSPACVDEPMPFYRAAAELVHAVLGFEVFHCTKRAKKGRLLTNSDLRRINALFWRWWRRHTCMWGPHDTTGEPMDGAEDVWTRVCDYDAALEGDVEERCGAAAGDVGEEALCGESRQLQKAKNIRG